jgi:SAM-dependent methyltransferase
MNDKANSDINKSRELHQQNKHYGRAESYTNPKSAKSQLNIPAGIYLANKANTKIASVLDYGCGKGGLLESIRDKFNDKIRVMGYDPGIDKYNKLPKQKFDLITCIDVLEHINKEDLRQTLMEIKKHTSGIFFYVVDLISAKKYLSDGRNAHILLAPPEWWSQTISSVFAINQNFQVGHLPDSSEYPIKFFGCATEDPLLFEQCSLFLKGTQLTGKQWIYDGGPNNVKIRPVPEK